MAAMFPEACSHVLAEFDSLDPLLSLLRLDSSRLKCTCLGVSRRWLALGSSGGGLNLIQRDCWKQRLFLAHKEGAISRVSCCPHDDDFVAVATSLGIVVVWELNQERRGKPERIYVSSEHKGRKVTSLCWDTAALRVFVGDHMGKVSAVRLNSSKQGKTASAFVMFPVQIITNVDSRVVQLDYVDGRLLISSLTRSYLCDTEREKFWRIGNKERDGEYGACFFPGGPSSGGPQPLIYCARPGSRMWEVNFEGEVQSTHQFKQLLSTPPLPVINARSDPQYDPTPGPPQSLAFSRLLFVGEHSVVTWTDRGIYVFIPQNVQVLLWSPVRGIQDISVYRNELYCLHADGKISHLSLLPAERCVERLIRRSSWALAAKVCHLFQNAVISSKARKSLPIDKLEHLKAQLDLVIQQDLIRQLEEILAKLETMDSACSSRRSSVSSHESFNVLDCGIYRVISRRNSQSDEDSGSLHSQTLSEDERLREVCAPPEEEQPELDTVSHASVNMEGNRTEPILPFTITLPFRSTSPRMSLQAVRESVSSFVRKTSEKIGTLHMSPEIRRKLETREERPPDPSVIETPQPRDEKIGLEPPAPPQSSVEEVLLQELKSATREAMHKIQDPHLLFNASAMEEILQNWLAYLEKALNPQHHARVCQRLAAQEAAQSSGEEDGASLDAAITEDAIEEKTDVLPESEGDPPFRLQAPCLLEEALHRDLAQLAMMSLAFRVFPGPAAADAEGGACRLMRTYFFLLDCKGLKRCILLNYKDAPSVWNTYIEGLKELSSGPESLAIENGDLVSTIQTLNSLEPWDSPVILAHVSRVYGKFGEAGARSLAKFYPSILPSDVAQFCRENPGHFLAYLDNLVKSKPEEQRLPLLQSLVQPESLKLDWLLLAVTHDAPHATNTVDSEGNPRPRSHLFTWGYGQLILLLIKLPSDFPTKEKMLSICKTSGYWPGYIALCLELDRRLEALAAIVYLDDLNLLDERNGLLPETMDEWKCLLHLAQSHVSDYQHHSASNGEALSNGHSNWTKCITVENVALLLAKVIGPERALPYLQDWGASERFSDRYFKICEVMKVAERRQRALIQSMLERCEGFLWSQQV